jgi:hypothetical protein
VTCFRIVDPSAELYTLYRSPNARMAHFKNCSFGIDTTIELKNVKIKASSGERFD